VLVDSLATSGWGDGGWKSEGPEGWLSLRPGKADTYHGPDVAAAAALIQRSDFGQAVLGLLADGVIENLPFGKLLLPVGPPVKAVKLGFPPGWD
jgi:hypothetical protein